MNKDYKDIACDVYDDMIASLELMRQDIKEKLSDDEYDEYDNGKFTMICDILTVVKDLRKELV